MELAAAGRQGGRVGIRGQHLAHDYPGGVEKNELKPHLKQQWCLGKLTTLFLWRMERVLALYSLPFNPQRPLICVDERPCQLIEDKLVPIPMEPGQPKREDYEYKRNGVCTVFIAFEPLTGFRITDVRARRTKQDYAAFMQKVAAHPHFAEAEQFVMVQDNLNTHNPGSFYTIMPAEQAYAFGQCFEMVFTPNKASWLNMAEIEFSVLARQCLNRRIGDQDVLESEVLAWTEERNLKQATVHWQFTLDKARDKFRRFYPDLE